MRKSIARKCMYYQLSNAKNAAVNAKNVWLHTKYTTRIIRTSGKSLIDYM